MNTSQSITQAAQSSKRVWRRHSDEFKAHVVEQARGAHVSVAAVALANGLNANMVRRWLRESPPSDSKVKAQPDSGKTSALAFVQLPISVEKSVPVEPALPVSIEVQIHRGQTKVVVDLPLGSSSAAWLREVLS